MTWGDDTSVVELRLSSATNGATTVEVEHTVPRAFAESGAGTLYVGPGWDAAVTALDAFLRGETPDDPAAEHSSEGQDLARRSTLAWAEVVDAWGTATAKELADAKAIVLGSGAPDS